MKRKKACAALLCAAMTVSGFPLGGGIVSAQENAKQETEFDIYVSPQGSDTEGDGSESAPYATIDRAREAARELTADGGSATVSVGEGKYFGFPCQEVFFGISVEKPFFLLYYALCGDIDNFNKER